MTQNIYDQPDFFQNYSQLDRSLNGLAGAPEWPALRALMPELSEKKVLDLGCGFGWFCRWAAENGAAHVDGIDVSDNMLARARATNNSPNIVYKQGDLERIALAESSYDLVYSSLTLHYLAQLERLFRQVHATLVLDGDFIFSVEHPTHTAPAHPEWMGTAHGTVWPLDHYLQEGARTTNWLASGVIKQHRTIAAYLNLLIQTGFVLKHIEEWGPTAEQIEDRPEWRHERDRPPFLLVHVQRAR